MKPVNSPARAQPVETLRVALLAQLDRRVDEHLDETQPGSGMGGAHPVAVGAVRRDHRHQRDQPGVGHQTCDLAHPTDVLGAVGGREPEVGVEPVTHVVAVEQVRLATGGMQSLRALRRRASTCPNRTGR